MNKLKFIELLNYHFPNMTKNQIDLIEVYKQFLQQENQKYNLTRLDADELVYEKYFYYSLIPFIGIDLCNKSLLDIGSGSGAPGIILKIIEPTLSLTIIESNNKKITFMQELANKLEFKDINFILGRAETNVDKHYESFDIVTSRAVSALNVILEISCQFVKVGGLIIEPKSVDYNNELANAIDILDEFGLSKPKINKYDEKNIILTFDKTKHANNIYPREWKIIIKNNKKENIHG